MPSAGPRQLAQRAAFGRRVRDIRLRQGLSQEDLANLSELDRSYVGGIERGERNVGLDNIYRLAEALGTDPVTLFTHLDDASDDGAIRISTERKKRA